MATLQFDSFIKTLKKVFMLDQADLDFGIYRIMNQKRKDIEKYLNENLKTQVTEVLNNNKSSQVSELENELKEARKAAEMLGISPDDMPKVKELKAKIVSLGNTEDLENEVYSHLSTFFSRYYDGGDFISQRRYKKDVYAIPYEGEEVKLHWANADQYYIKTSEYFRNYRFKLDGGKYVEFTLKEASTEQNNNKAQKDKERRFALYEECPVEVIDDELHINFTYELYPKATKQKSLIESAFNVVKDLLPSEFKMEVLALRPTDSDRSRTLLQKHLTDYVARNTFDYFIHKDLKGFLSRELDFYIKNEILEIDDIDARTTESFLAHLTVIKAIKNVGSKIIEFLASLENFQKRLWLKKKMVVSADYCITLDRVPEKFYAEICANDAQREEWVKLFAIDEIKSSRSGGLFTEGVVTGYSIPLSEQFLKENPFLVLDTAFFTDDFKRKLISEVDDLDEKCDGLLIKSENFQALNLIKLKYKNKIDCIYIDPPFNLGEDADYLYRVDYKNSTWCTLLKNRIDLTHDLYTKDGSIFIRCSHDGNMFVRLLLEHTMGSNNYRNEIILRRAEETKGDLNKQFGTIKSITVNYDNLYWYSHSASSRFSKILKPIASEKAASHWHSFWKAEDRPNMRYDILGIDLQKHYGQWMWERNRAKIAVENYLEYKEKFSNISLDKYWEITGKTKEFIKRDGDKISSIKYWIPAREFIMADNNWLDIKGYSNKWGFKTENSEGVLYRILNSLTDSTSICLDFFLGSGTTTAVAQKLRRKWIGVEMGEQFFTVIKPRMKMVLNGESSGISKLVKWTGGGMFKYIFLEQYEDTLNNLVVKKNTLMDQEGEFFDGYMLGYLLDTETKDSLFLLDWFLNPWNTKLKITRNNETKEEKIDLVETFNYLIGLKVQRISYPKSDICVVEGYNRKEEHILIIWRDCTKVSNEDLNEFFRRMAYSTRDKEFDKIYVNGDNNLENLKTDADTWKVTLIEQEFSKRMFEAE